MAAFDALGRTTGLTVNAHSVRARPDKDAAAGGPTPAAAPTHGGRVAFAAPNGKPGENAAAQGAVEIGTKHEGTGKVAGTADQLGVPTAAAPAQREFTRRVDKATGDVVLEHASEEQVEAGRFKLNIEIRMHTDGTADRLVKQRLDAAEGAFNSIDTNTRFSAAGRPVSETVKSHLHQGTADQHEDSTTRFNDAGKPIHKDTTQTNKNAETKPDGIRESSTQVIKAIYENSGQPIEPTTIPKINFTERGEEFDPKGGITKKDGRLVTTERHAEGPANALKWDPMKVVVRFNGHNKTYIEREFSYPINDKGQVSGQPKVVREVDKQGALDKAFLQTRIWGPLAGSLAVTGGIRLLPSFPKAGKLVMFAGAGISALETAGWAHAGITQRNDFSGARLVMSAYDTVFQGSLALLLAKRVGAGSMTANQLMAINGANFAGNAIIAPDVLPGIDPKDPFNTNAKLALLAGSDAQQREANRLRAQMAPEGEGGGTKPAVEIAPLIPKIPKP